MVQHSGQNLPKISFPKKTQYLDLYNQDKLERCGGTIQFPLASVHYIYDIIHLCLILAVQKGTAGCLSPRDFWKGLTAVYGRGDNHHGQ